MKTIKLLAPSLIGIALLVGLLTLLEGQIVHATPEIRFVAPGGDCNGANPCYATIQSAVDAAQPGDEIRVAEGTYTDWYVRPQRDVAATGVVTQMVYISKTLTLQGGYSLTNWENPDPEANPTRLDGQGHGRVIYITGAISPTIAGFQITGGNAAGLGGLPYDFDAGGGIYVITATTIIRDNQIFSNTAFMGGGLFILKAIGLVQENVVSNNSVTGQYSGGGGIAFQEGNLTVIRNIITKNLGDGIYVRSSYGLISENTISANIGTGIASTNDLASRNAAATPNSVTVSYNDISENTDTGLVCSRWATRFIGNTIRENQNGGIDISGCTSTLEHNFIMNNVARQGGGIYLGESLVFSKNDVIIGNTATVNGSGVYSAFGYPHISHATIANNHGGDGAGIHIGNEPHLFWGYSMITNTIIASQTVGIYIGENNTVQFNGVLWFNNDVNVYNLSTITLTHAITGNPAFAPDGYHLTAGSAAINAGILSGLLSDIDIEPRPYQNYDLGADEFWPPGILKSIFLPIIWR